MKVRMKRPTTMTAQYDARASGGVSSCLGALAAESVAGAASAVTVGGFVVVSAISLCCDFGCDQPAQWTTRTMRFHRAKAIRRSSTLLPSLPPASGAALVAFPRRKGRQCTKWNVLLQRV